MPPDSAMRGSEAGARVKPAVRTLRERVRAVIDIKQDRIETALVATDHVRDVAEVDADSRVIEWMAGKRPERPTIPANDCRVKFADHDRPAWRQKVKGRAERVAHSQPADEDARFAPRHWTGE